MKGMRAALALLLFAAAASAQPVVSRETIWRTASAEATYSPAPQAARIEPDRAGFVVAWTEVEGGVSRAYAGRLDGNGQLLSVDVHTSGAAGAVSIAPFGDRYIAAWHEPESGDDRPLLVTAALDRDFHLLSSRPVGLTDGHPIVKAEAGRAFIASGHSLYEVDRDGAPVVVYNDSSLLDDAATTADQIGYVFRQPRPNVVGFTWLFRLTAGVAVSFPVIDAPAGVAANGNTFLVVWGESGGTRPLFGSFFGTSFKRFTIATQALPAFGRLIQPQIASDGVRWVVVWQRGDRIDGAAITSAGQVSTFAVSGSGARPAIASVRRGRFVITYERLADGQRNLASRVIDFGESERERAAR
jgi:hypothetical protein